MTGASARGALRRLVPLGSGSIEKPLTSHGVAPAVSSGARRGLRRGQAEAQQHDRQARHAHRRQAGVNIGSGGPPSVGLKTTFTACSHFSLSKSQSTMLVTMRGPSASVT